MVWMGSELPFVLPIPSFGGDPADFLFCSPISSETELYPGKLVLKMGIQPRIPQPEAEGFGLHKHEWQGAHPEIDTYEIKWAGPEKKKMN